MTETREQRLRRVAKCQGLILSTVYNLTDRDGNQILSGADIDVVEEELLFPIAVGFTD